ncbi:MAG: hypothetical protein K6G46_10450 [Prevotella sp.]|nr:hypothetical protein [Prevotella sp.]
MEQIIGIDSFMEALNKCYKRLNDEYNNKFRRLEAEYSVCPQKPEKRSVYETPLYEAITPWGRSKIKKENKEMKAAAKREYEEELKAYYEDMDDYNRRKSSGSMLPSNILEQKKRFEILVDKIKFEYKAASEFRDSIVSKGVINSYYVNNFQALCFFVDCFKHELVYQLAGPDGAYKMWEEKMEKKALNAKLDTIIGMLNRIDKNQETLRSSVTSISEKSDTMINQMNAVISGQMSAQSVMQAIHLETWQSNWHLTDMRYNQN